MRSHTVVDGWKKHAATWSPDGRRNGIGARSSLPRPSTYRAAPSGNRQIRALTRPHCAMAGWPRRRQTWPRSDAEWNLISLKASARPYTTRAAWKQADGAAYKAARDHGLLDEVCAHMTRVYKPPAGGQRRASSKARVSISRLLRGTRRRRPRISGQSRGAGWRRRPRT